MSVQLSQAVREVSLHSPQERQHDGWPRVGRPRRVQEQAVGHVAAVSRGQRLAAVAEPEVCRDQIVRPAAAVSLAVDGVPGRRFQVQDLPLRDADQLGEDRIEVLRRHVHQHLRGEHDVEVTVRIGEPRYRLVHDHPVGDPIRRRPRQASLDHGRALVVAEDLDTGELAQVAEVAADAAAEVEDAGRGRVREVGRQHQLLDVVEDVGPFPPVVLLHPPGTVISPVVVARPRPMRVGGSHGALLACERSFIASNSISMGVWNL